MDKTMLLAIEHGMRNLVLIDEALTEKNTRIAELEARVKELEGRLSGGLKDAISNEDMPCPVCNGRWCNCKDLQQREEL